MAPLGDLLGLLSPAHVKNNASTSAAKPAAAETAAESATAPARYVRPTPEPPAPRMEMDVPLQGGTGLDWARKAAQAVIAHTRLLEWVDTAQPLEAAPTSGKSDFESVVRAYSEFDVEDAQRD
ncbi:MAG TPA: hypothetical protein VMF90_09535 [Rhizobiaceae bacterium]|nr:hypothetical protein [Rhizobiaceae bacterium]